MEGGEKRRKIWVIVPIFKETPLSRPECINQNRCCKIFIAQGMIILWQNKPSDLSRRQLWLLIIPEICCAVQSTPAWHIRTTTFMVNALYQHNATTDLLPAMAMSATCPICTRNFHFPYLVALWDPALVTPCYQEGSSGSIHKLDTCMNGKAADRCMATMV